MLSRLFTASALALAWTLSASAAVVFPNDTQWRYLPGLSEASPGDPAAWRVVGFDDSGWAAGRSPFFYEDQPGSGNALEGNTELTDMRGNYSCVFLRKEFVVSDPNDIREVQLTAMCDDGFIAWINGAEVIRFNMPGGFVPFNGTSRSALSEPVPVETAVLSQAEAHLLKGNNVIAVQAFNSGLGNSSDFGIWLSMSTSVDDIAPAVEMVVPLVNALVQRLAQVEVAFDEDVTGVDAADLLINGQPAAKVTAFSASQYVFEFPQPPDGKVTLSWAPAHGIHDLASAANPFPGGTWSYTLDPNAEPPGLLISEFMADNNDTLNDEDGDSSDWIEIFNAGSTTATLSGYSLTAHSNLVQWRFPNVSLLPNTYLLVFASEKNRTNPLARLHTDFKLAREGGYLALVDPDGKAVSEFAFYPAQFEDVSYGRERGNPNLLAFFPAPTPETPNASGGPGFTASVKFSRPAGTFSAPFALELSTESPDAAIRFTVDGSLPTDRSPVYSAPITVSGTVQVRAISFGPGLLPSTPDSRTYLQIDTTAAEFSSDLPVVVIHNFKGGRVPAGTRQFANISVFEPGFGRTSLTNRPALSTRGGINLRGSSTMGQSKSNFRVEFWNEYNDDQDHPLLGMPAEADWILYACNNFEPVLIHNKFAHDLSRQIGRYSPRARFVEVFVNTQGGAVTYGNYNGVYVLLERIKRGPDRIDIDTLQPEHSKAPEVTGGYVLSVDRSASDEGRLYAGGLGINAQDPKWGEITQPQRAAQYQYVTEYLDEMLTVLNSPNFADPVNGYAKYIDVPAAIDHHILNILTFNVDALRLSGYFYKPRNGKLTFGPLWDLDRALGSTDGRDSNPRLWRSAGGDRGTDMFNPDWIFSNPWYSPMCRDIDFWQRWIDRWQELRRDAFSLSNLHSLVDSLTAQVREAQKREVARWPGFTSPRWGSYQAEVDYLKRWLGERVEFIDTNFLAAPVIGRAAGQTEPGDSVTLSGPPGATIYYALDGADPRAAGGNVSGDARTYSGPITLAGNTRLVARARNLNHRNLTGANRPPLSSPWSGPVAATFVISRPTLTITEIMFAPEPGPGSGDREDFEFVELKNTGSATLNLIGAAFTAGIEYTFTAASAVTSLAPGEHVVLVKKRAAFATRYPGVNNVAGEFQGSLSNQGEQLVLSGPMQEPLLDFAYDDAWFPVVDGLGFSLVPLDENAAPERWSSRAHWRPSSARGGSPGTADPVAPQIPAVHVNEALTRGGASGLDTIELFNPTPNPADISGWFLSDNSGEPAKHRIPAGTVIPPGGYLLVEETQFGTGPNGFGLSAAGDDVYLFSADGANLTGYAHGFSFDAAVSGVSFGRHVNSVGEERFVAQVQPTLGQANAGPAIPPVVLTEVMFNPPALNGENNLRDEFIEIYNSSQQPVTLFDPAFPTNTWRLAGGVDFTFPTNIVLAPGQAMLVVHFDPLIDTAALHAFADALGLDTSRALLVGPFLGNLDNAGNRTALYRPDAPDSGAAPGATVVPQILVDELRYSNQPPWPTGANGTGKSIQRLSSNLYGDDPAHWIAADPTPAQFTPAGGRDADQDGLPDEWEIAHGLDPNSAADENGPDGDPDADGLTNLEEFLAGTDPRDSTSSLELHVLGVEDQSAVLEFQMAAGKSYSVLFRDSLNAGLWARLVDIPASDRPGAMRVSDRAFGTTPARFYRVITPAMP
ncbi:MAG: lamin tail domain-containing protein [Verrucomicrobiia bacterium]